MTIHSAQLKFKVLIIEPNKNLTKPYSYLSKGWFVTRLTTNNLTSNSLKKINPDMVFLSASLPPLKSLKFLETLKDFDDSKLTPLIIVVDLSHRLNFVPGTSWGGRIGVLDSFSSKKEFFATITRILSSAF